MTAINLTQQGALTHQFGVKRVVTAKAFANTVAAHCSAATTWIGIFSPWLHMESTVACRPSFLSYNRHTSVMSQGAPMTKLGIFVVTILAAAGAACDTEAWAAESVPTMASPAAAASAPKTCTGPWDFI